MALIADRNGEVVGDPLEVDVTVSGRERLITRVAIGGRRVGGARNVLVRIQAEGHLLDCLAMGPGWPLHRLEVLARSRCCD
jgi:hypothetical protein